MLLSALAVFVGIVAALVAAALYALIGFFTNLAYYGRLSFSFANPAGNHLGYLAIVVPVVGGLIIGLMARYGSERIRGHGIPEALESILINRSKVEPRLTVLKPVSSALSIGTGGPFGAEGPIIMTGGALGSVFAQFVRLSAGERKTLLVAGAAAGMAATFNTPVSAVLLAVELLLFEWKPRSLVPVGIASAVATYLSWYWVPSHGFGPLFPISATPAANGPMLAGAAVVGILAGALATLLTWSVYFFEDGFRKLPIHWVWWPAIGGLVVGIGGLVVPQALGVGYPEIDQLLTLRSVTGTVLVFVATLLVVKAVIWSVALGSGTSGGVLAPLLLLGGAVGVLESVWLPGGTVSLWVLVSMAACLGGTMRAPFTGIVFALELTHDLNALPPLLVAVVLADGFTVLSMKRSILTEKVARRGVHVAREYSVDFFERVPAHRIMRTNVVDLPAETAIAQAVEVAHDPEDRYQGYVVIETGGRVAGFVTRVELADFLRRGGDPDRPVRRLAGRPKVVGFTDEPVRALARRLAAAELPVIPILDPAEPDRVVGTVGRQDLFEAWALWDREQSTPERVFGLPTWAGIRARSQSGWRRLRSRLPRLRRDRDDTVSEDPPD